MHTLDRKARSEFVRWMKTGDWGNEARQGAAQRRQPMYFAGIPRIPTELKKRRSARREDQKSDLKTQSIKFWGVEAKEREGTKSQSEQLSPNSRQSVDAAGEDRERGDKKGVGKMKRERIERPKRVMKQDGVELEEMK